MNQVLKRSVYQRGTRRQAEFMAAIGGMNEEEKQLLMLLHDGKDDTFIQDTMGVSRNAEQLIEEAVRAKLLLAVFECINFARDNM